MAKNKNIQKSERESLNIKDRLFETLKASMPEAFSEGKVNWDKLRRALGEHLDTSADKFNFTWAGKAQAVANVLIPSKATLKPDKKESVKFDESENIFIEGDNLEVLKLLQKSYFEQVKMIYIDPPYNTGNDFVYKDDFKSPLKNYLEQSGQVDSEGNRLSTNTQASGRFHSDWLSMMYPRLKLAWNLLKHDGVIFISIDDNEVHHLRMLMDEVFGEENFIGEIINKSNPRGSQEPFGISTEHEYILCYSKSEDGIYSILGYERAEEDEEFSFVTEDGQKARLLGLRKRGGDWRRSDRPNMFYAFYVNPKTLKVSFEQKSGFTEKVLPVRPDGEESRWTWGKETAQDRINELVGKKIKRNDKDAFDIYRIDPLENCSGERKREKLKSVWEDKELNYQHARQYFKTFFGNSEIFDFPKPPELVRKLLLSLDTKDCIVLDYFAGSGTTGQAVVELNQDDGGKRKFILVQIPEPIESKSEAGKAGFKTITDIAKERIRKVLKGYGDHKPIDDGFKVFKLGESNYYDNLFEYDPDKSDEDNDKAFKDYLNQAQKELFPAKINELDIVYENIIKEGLNLNAKIEEIKIGKNKAYKVSDTEREFYIFLDEKVSSGAIDVLTAKEFKGKIFICFDGALTDSDKANFALNLTLKTI